MKRILAVAFLVLLSTCGCRKSESAKQETSSATQPERKGDFVTTFVGPSLFPRQRSESISYGLDPAAERYLVHVSQEYTGEIAYGLIVFTDADDQVLQLPEGWTDVLDNRRYLFVAAQNAENGQYVNRRFRFGLFCSARMWRNHTNPHTSVES